jgi:hypothetical protein
MSEEGTRRGFTRRGLLVAGTRDDTLNSPMLPGFVLSLEELFARPQR